jgi:glycerate 2-kinase
VAAAIGGADAGLLVRHAVARGILSDLPPGDSIDVLAVGKAAGPMARACLASAPAAPGRGLLIAPALDEPPPHPFKPLEGAHPVPDGRSVLAGQAALELARHVGRQGSLVALLSGGASSLMSVPAEGVSLEAKQAVTRRLLAADADIHAVNCVRKHLSAIKGGRLAAACAGRVITLAVSDVVGDDPSVIGSGPTVADPTTYDQALDVLDACGGRGAFPPAAVAVLEQGAAGVRPETPKPGDDSMARSTVHVIGSRADALAAGADAARRLGYRVVVAERPILGEARTSGADHAEWLVSISRAHQDAVCVLSAGETTVRVIGSGRGGRNQEFALAAAPVLGRLQRPAVLASVGTDGVDGPTDAAGAVADSTTLARARAGGLDPMQYLEANDAWSFFDCLDDLVRTGPTHTNVGDVQVALVAPVGC